MSKGLKALLTASAFSLALLANSPINSHEISDSHNTPLDNIVEAYEMVKGNITMTWDSENKMYTQQGTGFVFGKCYITTDHVVSIYSRYELISSGTSVLKRIDRVSENTYLDDRDVLDSPNVQLKKPSDEPKNLPLIEIINDGEFDIAVFEIPEEMKEYWNEGVRIGQRPYRIGEEVFWIGNPYLEGKMYRHGSISRHGVTGNPDERFDRLIGIDKEAIPGSSGSPVFRTNTKDHMLELIGVIIATKGGFSGYFLPINYFEPYLKGCLVDKKIS